jgi:UDP-N-acetylmuramate dehydrogenase
MTAQPRKVKHRVESMRRHLRGKLLLGEPLARHTTLGIGGPADAFFVPEDRADLRHGLDLCRDLDIPVLVIGNGSNLLVRDGGFRGVVINTARLTGLELAGEGGERAEVSAEAGILLSRLLNFCVSRGLGGLEWATGIPGSVGGALVMNAGASGSSMEDAVVRVDTADAAGEERRLPRAAIAFGYRTCDLPAGSTILAVGFALQRSGERVLLERIKNLLQERGRKLPFGWMNAGSVFKNPPGDHAGRLIEELGFKGKQIGDAQVSQAHANVIVNRGAATARDVLNLMDEIVREVRERSGLTLEPELKVVGEP